MSTEEHRIQAAIAGRRDATESLLAELLPRVRSFVRYSVHGDSEVDDITQEALIAILRGLPTYRGEGAFASWANRVVARVTFAASKRARTERCQVDDESVELTSVPSEEALPDDCLMHREVVELLEQLSDEQRRALLLHYVMGMSIPEMAEALEVPFETVRSRLRTGKAHLREILFRES
ncbi:RNA polymerase sigma factor [Archangium sp.]|uniref:RNA polymerase sigma factor n=1 Tax=Archangium sp. TaxID=1872627 RepID=UPI002D6E7E88|nr:RNA polymerase sigma factor [Archangium sp.]HYO59463.1 RNA polymerase sigma factor [Archangium sp.]